MRDGIVSGDNYGNQTFHDNVSFAQGVGGAITPGAVFLLVEMLQHPEMENLGIKLLRHFKRQ